MLLFDLHTHTRRSDGLLAPAALVREACRAGLSGLALTDHDQVAGIPEAADEASALNFTLIPGVELSVRDTDGSDQHLLGLFVDPDAPVLGAYLDALQEGRREMGEETLTKLASLGMPLDAEQVKQNAAGAALTRPHIARAMVDAGYVASIHEAFEKFLASGRPAAIQRPLPDARTAIGVVTEAGGVVGLAHPVFGQEQAWRDHLQSVPQRLDRLVEAGLSAVECFYPDANPTITERLLAWSKQHGLVAIGGSDYHGPRRAPYAPLGAATTEGAVVEQLRERRRVSSSSDAGLKKN